MGQLEQDVYKRQVVDLSPQRFTTLMYEAGGSMLTEDLSASNFKSEGVKRSVESVSYTHLDVYKRQV